MRFQLYKQTSEGGRTPFSDERHTHWRGIALIANQTSILW
jgi:hypothetical protein